MIGIPGLTEVLDLLENGDFGLIREKPWKVPGIVVTSICYRMLEARTWVAKRITELGKNIDLWSLTLVRVLIW